MVILGSDGSKNYRNITEFLTDPHNHVDPKTAALNADLIAYRIADGQAEIVARGHKKACDGRILVLTIRPTEYDYVAGVPLLGTGGRLDLEPTDRTQQVIPLEGLRVADGVKYAAWTTRRGGGRKYRGK